MPAVQLTPFTKSQWFSSGGDPLAGGKLFSFSAGTSTPLATYTDSTGSVPNPNPVVLDAAGRADVWLNAGTSYKLVMQDANGVQLWTEDGVNPALNPATLGNTNVAGNFSLTQPTAATALVNQSSFSESIQAQYWNGASTATDQWTLQNVLGTGTNPTSTLTFGHSGSSGATIISIPSGALKANAQVLNAIRFADQFAGANVTAQINAAESDLGTNQGLVIVPSSMGAGAGQSLASTDNITVWDLRGGASPASFNTHLHLNVKDTDNANVRQKMILYDTFTPSAVLQAGSSSASLEAATFLEGNLTGMGSLEALNGTITVDSGATNSPSVINGIEGTAQVNGTVANTITDIRGGNFNVGAIGAGNITTATALYAQAPSRTSTGTIANAIALKAENPTVGTSTNLSGQFLGKVEIGASLTSGGGSSAALVVKSTTGPAVALNATSNGADLKQWDIIHGAGGSLQIRAVNDANSAASTAIQISRSSGTTIDDVTVNQKLIQATANGAQWIQGQASENLTLSTGGTTTDTSANLLPANSIIEAVVARVTTTITTATDWKLGDPATAGRFAAANAVMTSGSTSIGTVQADQTGAAGPRQAAAAKVRVTTTGTPGAGAIRITVFYRQFVAPTS